MSHALVFQSSLIPILCWTRKKSYSLLLSLFAGFWSAAAICAPPGPKPPDGPRYVIEVVQGIAGATVFGLRCSDGPLPSPSCGYELATLCNGSPAIFSNWDGTAAANQRIPGLATNDETKNLVVLFVCEAKRNPFERGRLDPAKAKSFEEKLLIGATLEPKHSCAIQFPALQDKLLQGFRDFVQKNKRYLTESEWKEEAENAVKFPQVKTLTREECDAYARDLPVTNVDNAIDTLRAQKSCEAALERSFSLPTRVVIGVELDRSTLSARLKGVMPKSPAVLAGLLPGDEVISYNGTEIKLGCELALQIGRSQANVAVPLVVVRSGVTHSLTVIPRAIPNKE